MSVNYEATLKAFVKTYNDYENSMQIFFKEFLKHLSSTKNEIVKERKKLPVKFNILDFFNISHYEKNNTKLLTYLFNTKIEYQNESIDFGKLFINFLNERYEWELDIQTDIEALAEYHFIDIFIKGKNFSLIIENKIYAKDQEAQIKRYYDDIGENENRYVLYLTTTGYNPSRNSLPEELEKELGDRFQTIRHGDIGLWLEGVLKDEKFSFIKTEEKYRHLYSALIQITENEKHLSYMTEEDNMEKNKIKELIDSVISNKIETIEDAEEYRNLFKTATVVIDEKIQEIKYKQFDEYYRNKMEATIKHALKVAQICQKQDSKFKALYDYETIREEFYKKYEKESYLHIIEIPIINKSINVGIWLEIYSCWYQGCNDDYAPYYGIYVSEQFDKYNRFFKKIEDKVKKEFPEAAYDNSTEEDWKICIDFTPKDKAEDVARKFITLYKLFSEAE